MYLRNERFARKTQLHSKLSFVKSSSLQKLNEINSKLTLQKKNFEQMRTNEF